MSMKKTKIVNSCTKNHITNTCAKLVIIGSRSTISNSISHVSKYLKCERSNIVNQARNIIPNDNEDDVIKASIIRDICQTRYLNKLYNQVYFLSYDQLNFMLEELCTA